MYSIPKQRLKIIQNFMISWKIRLYPGNGPLELAIHEAWELDKKKYSHCPNSCEGVWLGIESKNESKTTETCGLKQATDILWADVDLI